MRKWSFCMLAFFVFAACIFFRTSAVHAQFLAPATPPGFTTDESPFMYEIQDKGAMEGDIVVASSSGLLRSDSEFADNIFGIVVPVIQREFPFIKTGEHPVARTGEVNVSVTDFNGTISYGDPITSSVIAGKGQKATKSGFIIGYALEGLSNSKAEDLAFRGKTYKAGNIKVALLVHFYQLNQPTSVFAAINNKLFPNSNFSQDTIQIMRLIAAVLISFVGFLISYFTFARSIIKASQAVKRNPSVKRSIRMTIIINLILSFLLALMSVAASWMIMHM